jgi:alpha-2-macroglobulin
MAVKPNELKGKEVVVKTQGTGGTYYFWQIEGIPVTESVTEEDSYLKVRRRYYDRFGRPIEGNKFKQNDLVIVQVSIEKSFSNSIDNVVITDLLPAGFEIENARTTQIPGMDWIKNASTPQHIDVRDDRINLFVSVNSNTAQYYYYAVRAVSKGTYKQGVVSADAMYNGEYHSYWGQRMVEIE